MKLGPLHVVTDRTMGVMQSMLRELSDTLAQADHDRLVLADRLTTARDVPAAPNYLHCPAHARLAPVFLLEPDADTPRSREAVSRVVTAYRLAMRNHVPAARGIWEAIETRNAEFIDALGRGDEATAGAYLRRMFTTNLGWGLGYLGEEIADSLRAQPEGNIYQLRVTDMLVALAEAVGVTRLTNPEQSLGEHIRALDVDLDEVFRAVERETGLDLSLPAVGAAFGCLIADRRVSPDTLVHGYTVQRLRELGATPDDTFAEIGGGFGCLAYQMFRAGFTRFTVHDLPWVNALQGYFLIMSLPEGSVRLYGERKGSLALFPGWTFGEHADRSADWVINTNSMPEMGADTARDYLREARRVVRQGFFSINMEAKPTAFGYGRQGCVAELVAEVGGFRRTSRSRYWMRNGYVEEVYRPSGEAGS